MFPRHRRQLHFIGYRSSTSLLITRHRLLGTIRRSATASPSIPNTITSRRCLMTSVLPVPFDSHRVAFEQAGGDLAWRPVWPHGWPACRAARATEIISVSAHARRRLVEDLTGHLQVATGWDKFSGGDRSNSLRRHGRRCSHASPRQGLVTSPGVLRRSGATQAGQRRPHRRQQCSGRIQGQPARRLGQGIRWDWPIPAPPETAIVDKPADAGRAPPSSPPRPRH